MIAQRIGVVLGLSSFLLVCARSPGAIEAKIYVDGNALAPCVRVAAISPGGAEVLSTPIVRGARADLVVAIFQGSGLSGTVNLRARGYIGKNGNACDAPLALNEEGPSVSATFPATGVTTVTLQLPVLDASLDQDHDGYRGSASGGADCNDQDPTTHPGAAEVCNDYRDHDCDGLVSCADPDCNNAPCAGDLCTNNGTCVNTICNGAVPIICNTPPACRTGIGVCALDAGCLYAASAPAVTCADDGNPCTDDHCDGDGGCIHPSKPDNTSCGMPNACTVGTCQTGSCSDSPVSCAAVQCFSAGCVEDAGCSYQPTPGLFCDAGVCAGDGGCVAGFQYTPTNFVPADLTTINPALDVSCIETFDSTTASFGGTCAPGSVIHYVNDAGAVVVPVYGLIIRSGAGLNVVGPNPVIFAVFGDAVINGFLDASARFTLPGAGGSANGGPGGGLDGGAANSGGGGGASHGTSGAAGGDGQSSAGSGGPAGTPYGNATLSPLLGGSAGGSGSAPGLPGGGAGGAGGGALQLSITGTLVVDGGIWAAGGGGGGGASGLGDTGGGGGGSGGAILLEADGLSLAGTATLTANGGAGGEGCSSNGTGCAFGENGHLVDAAPALGGHAGPNGNGGNGSATAGAASDGGLGGGGGGGFRQGGGGGGGGMGSIRYNSPHPCDINSSAVRSPKSTNTSCQ